MSVKKNRVRETNPMPSTSRSAGSRKRPHGSSQPGHGGAGMAATSTPTTEPGPPRWFDFPIITNGAEERACLHEHNFRTMKHTLAFLTALLLAPLAALHEGRHLKELPNFGRLRVGSFQSLENCGGMTSNDWN